MSILPQLKKNKGTVSSALGKALAQEVLAGTAAILEEAIELLAYEDKNVRAGAAKIIEQVALADPPLVAGYLPRLLPALEAPEPQTRWMVIHTLGLCSSLDPATALEAYPRAEEFVRQESGACLWGATIKYLGQLGATSQENGRMVFPLLEEALRVIPRQKKAALEGFLRLLGEAGGEMRAKIASYAQVHLEDERASVRKEALRIQKELGRTQG